MSSLLHLLLLRHPSSLPELTHPNRCTCHRSPSSSLIQRAARLTIRAYHLGLRSESTKSPYHLALPSRLTIRAYPLSCNHGLPSALTLYPAISPYHPRLPSILQSRLTFPANHPSLRSEPPPRASACSSFASWDRTLPACSGFPRLRPGR